MKFSDAKELVKKFKGSKIVRDGDEFVVKGKAGELIDEMKAELISKQELTIYEEKSLDTTLSKQNASCVKPLKGVGPDMKWKGKKVFSEPYTDMLDSGKVYKGAYGTGKRR